MAGQKFGNLTVIGRSDKKDSRGGNQFYLCKCECGKEKSFSASRLNTGVSTACGCKIGKNTTNRPRKPPGYASLMAWYRDYAHGAKSRSRDFLLTVEEFSILVYDHCHYCGALPMPYNGYITRKSKKRKTDGKYTASDACIDRAWINVNGIDRKDNSVGYTVENCVPCCPTCNKAKHNSSYEEFILYLDNLVNFRTKK